MKKAKNFSKFFSKEISFILVTKNRARYLEQALKRCKRLVKKNDELIVIDGESDDSSKKIAEKYGSIIDIFLSEKDLYPAHAANKGVLLSRGKYVIFLQDDDIIYPAGVKKAISVLKKNPTVDLIICGGKIYYKESKKTEFFYIPPGIGYGSRILNIFRFGGPGVGLVIKKQIFAQAGLLPLNITADTFFMINCILARANFQFCRIMLFKTIVHKNSLLIRNNKELDKIRYELLKSYVPKSTFYRYIINKYLIDHPHLTHKLAPVIFVWNQTKILFFRQKHQKNEVRPVWDGGFS